MFTDIVGSTMLRDTLIATNDEGGDEAENALQRAAELAAKSS